MTTRTRPEQDEDGEPYTPELDELAPPETPPTIPFNEFTARDWYVYRLGQQHGHESRQWEVDAARNDYLRAEHEADRLYHVAFAHEYHDCTVHEYRGKYQGARTRLADDDRMW